MLSVLPLACEETAPWASCFSRKRPLPVSCVSEFQSAAVRAKRLKQELLRLREWEQQAQLEAFGAQEGVGDSCDESVSIEPLSHVLPVHQSAAGHIFYVEDASDATNSSSRTTPSISPVSVASLSEASHLCDHDQDLIRPDSQSSGRKANSTPVVLQRLSSLPVHTWRTVSLPQKAAFPSLSAAVVSSGPFSGTLALVQEIPGAEDEEEDGQQEGSSASECDVTGTGSPLRELWTEAATVGDDSVQQVVSDDGTEATEEDELSLSENCNWVSKENLPREETSRPASGIGSGDAGGCVAQSASPLVLPPLPPQFLGMPMSLRLRLLEFLMQASDILGLGVQSLYLAAALLDCCWVEETVRRQGQAGGCGSLSGAELQLTAVTCLLHAFLSREGLPASGRSIKGFLHKLSEGAATHSRVAAMLPVKAASVEKQLWGLQQLLPMAAAQGVLSVCPRVYASMLELRKLCSQAEHNVIFIAQLFALGFKLLPCNLISAANCCLVTGAVCKGHADGGSDAAAEHHLDHFAVLGFVRANRTNPSTLAELELQASVGRMSVVGPTPGEGQLIVLLRASLHWDWAEQEWLWRLLRAESGQWREDTWLALLAAHSSLYSSVKGQSQNTEPAKGKGSEGLEGEGKVEEEGEQQSHAQEEGSAKGVSIRTLHSGARAETRLLGSLPFLAAGVKSALQGARPTPRLVAAVFSWGSSGLSALAAAVLHHWALHDVSVFGEMLKGLEGAVDRDVASELVEQLLASAKSAALRDDSDMARAEELESLAKLLSSQMALA